VEYFDGGTAITVRGGTTGVTLGGSATANCAVTYTSTGGHTIIVKYLGTTGTFAVSALSSSITQTVSASSAVTGSSTGNLVTDTDCFQLPSASAGSALNTHDSFSAGTAATLTSFSFTIRSATTTAQTATIGSISDSSWTVTGLTCAITGGLSLKTCTIVLSVPIPGANSVNLQVGGGGGTGVSGTWTTTDTVPYAKVKGCNDSHLLFREGNSGGQHAVLLPKELRAILFATTSWTCHRNHDFVSRGSIMNTKSDAELRNLQSSKVNAGSDAFRTCACEIWGSSVN
jgi:hypothetical protein